MYPVPAKPMTAPIAVAGIGTSAVVTQAAVDTGVADHRRVSAIMEE
jgi:hypothetical protein